MTMTLHEIAQKVGVSHMTVSRVLNNKDRGRVSASTRERVLLAVREDGYRPNAFARRLQGNRTMTLGLMVGGFENPFFVWGAREFEKNAVDFGYQVLVDTTMAEPWAYREHGTTCAWPVDGAFIWSREELDLKRHLGAQATQMPIVYVNYQDENKVDSVCFDMYDGGRQIVEYVIERGYRKITYAALAYRSPANKPDPRVAACEDICKDAGLKPEMIYVDQSRSICSSAVDLGVSIASRPRKDRPDVVLCSGDLMAMGVYHGILRAGLRVPEDIGVAGFDGIENGQCLDKPLTTIACPMTLLARSALELLTRRLSDAGISETQEISIPTQLLVGRTTR